MRHRVTNHESFFNKHLENLNLSRRDAFIEQSIALSYFSGWADCMNHLTENWFNGNAEKTREPLDEALKTLQEMQADKDDQVIDLSEPEPVSMNYSNIKLD